MSDRFKTVRRIQITITVIATIIVVLHLIWPALQIDGTTLFLLTVAVVPWLIPLFKSLEFPGGWKVEFQEQEYLEIKEKAIEQAASASKIKINWEKVATLFWLGNDLMWIQDMVYRAASPERILQGINFAVQYAKELGFEDKSNPIQNLSLAKTILEPLVGITPNEQNKTVLEGHYRTVQQYIQAVKWYIDALAKIQQPDFKKLRAL